MYADIYNIMTCHLFVVNSLPICVSECDAKKNLYSYDESDDKYTIQKLERITSCLLPIATTAVLNILSHLASYTQYTPAPWLSLLSSLLTCSNHE